MAEKKTKSLTMDIGKGKEIRLHHGNPFWHCTMDHANFYENLTKDISTEVCIIGGGMSGALMGYRLTKEGFDSVLLDKMQPGMGSSDGNTGIIQYNSDRSLAKFIEVIGEQKALDFYTLCHDSMLQLDDIMKELKTDTGYRPIESLQVACQAEDFPMLEKEYAALKKYDFPAFLISKQELAKKYDIHGHGAIRTKDDAMINPYKVVHALHQASEKKGLVIYGNTKVQQVTRGEKERKITVTTADGRKVKATYVIFCTGYTESYSALKKRDERDTTFSLVTNPIKGALWDKERMIWDTKDPYLYFRVTEDKRIIAGGLDRGGKEMVSMTEINLRAARLMEKMKEYFPQLDATAHYVWQSVFGVSKDEIPFIGADPKHKNIFYALGYGGNGTCYSVAASEIIATELKGKKHPRAYVVAPGR